MNLHGLVGLLLDYPGDELWAHAGELRDAVASVAIPAGRREQLAGFVEALLAADPLEAQERWLATFDRGRAMSLLLFEHIHGESRDRGQAMVDLVEAYRRGGLEIDARELPDYLPLLLEYLDQRPAEEAVDWLAHIVHILGLLAARAGERGSPYALLFEVLVEQADSSLDLGVLRRRAKAESRDDSAEEMDRVWEEEAVRFCGQAPDVANASTARPVTHTPADFEGQR